ncbi:uncharacterized protein LOC114363687 [Ostrinia furnacalis]|uniref:uncharacterized protein LOC114363687 n=1 Tax=Ostrinia furnacalis TaxID=93504 RepID=UPI0010401CF6|nr:uncharacterized protein LOC114363687 [Ostrinia furnacalis]
MPPIVQCDKDDLLLIKELNPVVRQNIKQIINKEGFVTYTVNVKDVTTNGANYLGTLQTVTVSGKTKDGDKELHLFLKNIINEVGRLSVLNVSEAYLKEGFCYKELFKIFETIEDKYNIPQEKRLNTVKGYSETNSEVIILDDVSKMGYKAYNRFGVMTKKIAELAFEQLAKLHAMSFIIRKEYPKYFENKIKSLNTLFNINSEFENHLRNTCNKAMETLEGDAKAKLRDFCPKMVEKYSNYIKIAPEEAVCITHGDFQPNNLLLKETNGEPSSVMIIDFQFAYYGNPVTDLIFFIFLGTDQKFRKDHMEDLKELYYGTFESFLSDFGISASVVYSKRQFEDDFKEKLDFGLMCFIQFMPFLFARTDQLPELQNGLASLTLKMDERYKNCLHGVVDDFIQWGYL